MISAKELYGYNELQDDAGWDVPSSGSYATPEGVAESACRSQGLRIVSASSAGLGGLTEETNQSQYVFPDPGMH